MAKRRVEVRLEEGAYRRLEEIAAWREAALAEVVREAVDHLYGELEKKRKLEALERLAAVNAPAPPPEQLRREILEGLYGDESGFPGYKRSDVRRRKGERMERAMRSAPPGRRGRSRRRPH